MDELFWPVILSLCTDAFPFVTNALDSIRFWSGQDGVTPSDAAWIADLYGKSGIQNRRLAVPDIQGGAQTRHPSDVLRQPIEARLQRARDAAFSLVLNTARRTLEESGLRPADIGQIVVVSSTVLATPGLDVDLIGSLGLPRDVVRTGVTYAGCAAGIQGLSHAARYHESCRKDRRNASLVVCVEVSSTHAFAHTDKSQRVTHAIFGDGVACAVIGSAYGAARGGRIAIGPFASYLPQGLEDGIVLGITEQGVTCSLSPRLPQGIVDNVGEWLAILLEKAKLDRKDIGFWTIHTGGKKILESVQAGLGLTREQISTSWDVLEQYGNTVSCGVFYVLDQMMKTGKIAGDDYGVALSFAPGVSAEGLILAAT